MTDITSTDLQPWRSPDDLLSSITRIPSHELGRYRQELRSLVDHEDEDVREQAVRRLFVHLSDSERAGELVEILLNDPAANVRRAAAFGILSLAEALGRDVTIPALLRAILRDDHVRVVEAAYESLHLLLDRREPSIGSRQFEPKRDIDWRWIESLRTEYDVD